MPISTNRDGLRGVGSRRSEFPSTKISAIGVTTQLNINHVVVSDRFLSIRVPWSIGIRAHTSSGARGPNLHLTFPEEQIGYNASQAHHECPSKCIAKAINGETND